MENKLTKHFIPYPFALRMKALGYDEPCFTFFTAKGLMYMSLDFNGIIHIGCTIMNVLHQLGNLLLSGSEQLIGCTLELKNMMKECGG